MSDTPDYIHDPAVFRAITDDLFARWNESFGLSECLPDAVNEESMRRKLTITLERVAIDSARRWAMSLPSSAEAIVAQNTHLKIMVSEAAHEINCRGPLAERIRVLKTDHGQRVERLYNRIGALESVCEAVLNSDMAMREEDEGCVSGVLNQVRAALGKATEATP